MYVIVFWKKWSSALFWIFVYFSVMHCVAVMISVIENGREESNYSVCCACVTEVRGSVSVYVCDSVLLWLTEVSGSGVLCYCYCCCCVVVILAG